MRSQGFAWLPPACTLHASNSPTPTASQSHLRNASCRLLELFGQVLGLTHITPRSQVNPSQAEQCAQPAWTSGVAHAQPPCPFLFMSLFSDSYPDETNVLMSLELSISPTKPTPLGGLERAGWAIQVCCYLWSQQMFVMGVLWGSSSSAKDSFCLPSTSLAGCSPPSLKWCWTGASEMGISPPGLTRVFLPSYE